MNEMALHMDNGGAELSVRQRLRLQEAVCKVELLGGSCGSGSLVDVNGTLCVLTNNHVLGTAQDAKHAHALFVDRDDERAKVSFTDELFLTDVHLDFTFASIDKPPVCGSRKIVPVALSSGSAHTGDSVYVVQYPRGGEKKDAIQRVSGVDGDFVQYLCDTDYGSSGSPVFKMEEVIALHHRRDPLAKANQGVSTRAILHKLASMLDGNAQVDPTPPASTAAAPRDATGLHTEASITPASGWQRIKPWRIKVTWRGGESRLQAAGGKQSTKKDSQWMGRVVAHHATAGVHRIEYDDGGVEIAELRSTTHERLDPELN
jgi:hypothetical protein